MPYRTGLELWALRVAASGDRLAFKHRKGGAWIGLTWAESDAIAREIAAGLVSLGLRPGDRVCILAQTRLEWFLSDVAVMMAGAVSVPVYPSSTSEQAAFIVKDSGARVVVCEDAAQLEKILPLLASGDLRAVYVEPGEVKLERADGRGRAVVSVADAVGAAPPGTSAAILGFDDLRRAGRGLLQSGPGELERRSAALRPGDPFTIIYTSGTTGVPKGVVLTHANFAAAIASACRALTLTEHDLQYHWLTLAHVLGREVAWAPVHVGAPTAFTEGVLKIKDNLVDVRPTFMVGVPRVFEKFHSAVRSGMRQATGRKRKLVDWAVAVGQARSQAVREGRAPGPWLELKHRVADKLVFAKLRGRLGLDRCRFLISGGAPLAPEIAEFFHAVGLLVLEGYGLTETMGAAFVNRVERHRFGTVGPALDVIECKIADDGEILMRGPSVFATYYKNPAATAEAIDGEGWFHSGDIGQLEDGFLRITDRKKDLIVTAGGKKVAPQALETAIKARCAALSQVMVYGDRRPYCVALVTLTEEAVKRYGGGDGAQAASSPELRALVQAELDALNATLPGYEQVKRFTILPADFSEAAGDLTPSLKVKRKVVVDRNRALIDGLYGGVRGR